eukprot:m.33273 g.33273  ORF g.33273 m.33273 type:complete len:268 (+) comp12216_c0_seq3:255-1058(+)
MASALTDSYRSIIATVGNPQLAFTALFGFVNMTNFALLNVFLTLCYRNNWFPAQRIRPVTKMPSDQLVTKALWHVLLANVILVPVMLYFGTYPALQWRGCDLSGALPSWYAVVRDILVAMMVEDTMFYWIHRTLHHKSLYKHIHKQHHLFGNSIGIAAEYAHPVEAILGNVIPFWAGPLLMKSNLWTMLIWFVLRVWEATDSHSGYAFEWSPWNLLQRVQGGAARHDYHHSHNIGSYGSFFKFWDWIMGTDQQFNEFMAKQQASKLK